MKRRSLRIMVLMVLGVISTVTVLALAITFKKRAAQPLAGKNMAAVKEAELVYDPVLLKKFRDLGHVLDFNKKHCTYAGVINIDDGRDTANTVHGIKFLFCRAGKDFYYRVGNTETIYRDGMHVFIQQDQHKVVLSANDMNIKSPVSSMDAMENSLRGEKYALVSRTSGGAKTLSIVNNTHITCKELSFTWDTASGKLTGVYTRLSDLGDPLNKKRDRVISVALETVDDKGNLGRYPEINDVIRKKAGKWELTENYAKYELIIF